MSYSLGIPSVDLADFLSGDPQRENKFVQELGQAYQEIGFVALKNHGLSEELRERLYREVTAFSLRIPPLRSATKSKVWPDSAAIPALARSMPRVGIRAT